MRHFHIGGIKDPIEETPSAMSHLFVNWTGWRCRLIRWLIQRWMPRPIVWNVTRKGGTE